MNLVSMFPRGSAYRADVLQGPLGPYIDGFIDSVSQRGYTQGSLRSLIQGAVYFGRYLANEGLRDLRTVDDRHVRAYIATTRVQRHGKYRFHVAPGARAAPHVLRYLRQIGVASPASPPVRRFTALLEEWLSFLRMHRGLAEKSLQIYRQHITRFLEHLGRDATPAGLRRLSVERIRRYVNVKASTYGRSERKTLVSTLRIFLRWAFAAGYLRRDLTIAVERVPSFKHEQLPRGPRWDDLPKLLEVQDRSTAQGTRDYAILLILITYGMRAQQVVSLQLEDVNWRKGTLHFRAAKRGRDVDVPLTAAVGESIVDYLRRGRPSSSVRSLFLTMRPPWRALRSASIRNIVSRAFGAAGIPTPHRGSHAIRHAWATQMLTKGQSLKTIADLLGHRSIETTRIYAKVDLSRLREAALPWPKENSR